MTPLSPVVATDPFHLEDLIEKAIAVNGLQCDLNHIDVSKIERFNALFMPWPKFNGDISRWNVSNATNMSEMFRNGQFNGDISHWNVAKVSSFNSMFEKSMFDGDVSQWNTASATNFDFMFSHAAFNGDISKWNTSAATSMFCMFTSSKFQGDVSLWDTSRVTNMTGMFDRVSFNGDVSDWNTAAVTTMRDMFKDSAFTGDVSRWNTHALTETIGMFLGSPFAGDLSAWQLPLLDPAKSKNMFPTDFAGVPPLIGADFGARKELYQELHGGPKGLSAYLARTSFNRVHFDVAAHSPRKPQGISKQDRAWARNMGEVGQSLGMGPFELERYALSRYGKPSVQSDSIAFAFEAP